MTDHGGLNYFLSIMVSRDRKGMFLSQQKYVLDILERAKMQNCKSTWIPAGTSSKLGVSDPLVADLNCIAT